MKIRVSRRRWLRGNENGRLLDKSGRMCCLGFGARQCGVKAKALLNVGMPGTIADADCTQALYDSPLLCGENSKWDSVLSEAASEINDDPTILTDRQRETQLRTLFRKHGHQIVFVP